MVDALESSCLHGRVESIYTISLLIQDLIWCGATILCYASSPQIRPSNPQEKVRQEHRERIKQHTASKQAFIATYQPSICIAN